jgi:hypothetical protein
MPVGEVATVAIALQLRFSQLISLAVEDNVAGIQ